MTKTPKALVSLVILVLLTLLSARPAFAQETWNVALTGKQSKGLQQAMTVGGNVAFAISPDGPWGWAHGLSGSEEVEVRALQYCRGFLRKGQRDCLVYMKNRSVVLPATVKTQRVSAVYKPLHPRRAAGVLGLAPIRFGGRVEQARKALPAAIQSPRGLRQDPGLRKALQGRTIMNSEGRPFAVWLGPKRAGHAVSTNNGVLNISFDSWVVTAHGLICLMGGAWESTGKRDGDKCLILGPVDQGKTTMYWGNAPDKKRAAVVIAGDGRFGAAR